MKKDKLSKVTKAGIILGTTILLVSGCDKNVKTDKKIDGDSNIVSNSNENNTASIASKVGNFVNYDDYTYFWKLNSNSRDNIGLFGEWKADLPVNNNSNELIKMDKNGKQEVIYKGAGMGKIAVVSDHIYFMALKDSDYYTYSISLDGKDVKELGKGTISHSDNNIIFGILNNNGTGIYSIDSKDNTYKVVNEKATLLDVNKEVIYYQTYSGDNINIGSIKNGTDNGVIATLDSKVFKSFDNSMLQIQMEKIIIDDTITIYYGYRDGSANIIQELAKATMNLDGTNLKTELITGEDTIYTVLDNYINEGQVYIQKGNIKYISNGKENNIISTEEFAKKNNLTINDETTLSINGSDVYDDVAYAIIDYGVHNSKEDIGWRYAYNRTKTIVTKIDLRTNEMTVLYQY